MKKNVLIVTLSFIATIACADKKTEENSGNLKIESTEVTSDPKEILGKEWQLKELNGAQIVLDTTFGKYPYIKFEDLKTATGNLGCNGFGAKVEFTYSNSIKLSEITSTEMACGNLDTEIQFKKALQNTTNYGVSENILYLNNSENTTVAILQNIVKD